MARDPSPTKHANGGLPGGFAALFQKHVGAATSAAAILPPGRTHLPLGRSWGRANRAGARAAANSQRFDLSVRSGPGSKRGGVAGLAGLGPHNSASTLAVLLHVLDAAPGRRQPALLVFIIGVGTLAL